MDLFKFMDMDKKDKVVNSDDEKPQASVLTALIGDQSIQSSRYVVNFVRNMSLLHPLSTPRNQFEDSSLVKMISSVMSTVGLKTFETPLQIETAMDYDSLLKAFLLPPYPSLRYPLIIPPASRLYGYLQYTDRPSLVQMASRINYEPLGDTSLKNTPKKLDLLSVVKPFAEPNEPDSTPGPSEDETDRKSIMDRNLESTEANVDENSKEQGDRTLESTEANVDENSKEQGDRTLESTEANVDENSKAQGDQTLESTEANVDENSKEQGDRTLESLETDHENSKEHEDSSCFIVDSYEQGDRTLVSVETVDESSEEQEDSSCFIVDVYELEDRTLESTETDDESSDSSCFIVD